MQGCSQALRQPQGGFPWSIPAQPTAPSHPLCHLCSSLGTPSWAGPSPRCPPPRAGLSPSCPRAVPQGEDGEGEGARPPGGGHPGGTVRGGAGRGHAEGAASLPAPHVRGGGCAGGLGALRGRGDAGDRCGQSCAGCSVPVPTTRAVPVGAAQGTRLSPSPCVPVGSWLGEPPVPPHGAVSAPCRMRVQVGYPAGSTGALHPRPPGPDPTPPLPNQGLAFGAKGDPLG